jgi:acyl-CoA thioester hydrolase
MGHAYYGNYLRWFELGRNEWLRSLGMTYREWEARGVFLPVVEAHCRYHGPAYYDDMLVVATGFRFSGPARLRFDYEILREGEETVLADGYTVHVCVDERRKPMKPPRDLRTLLQEAGSGG